jgi:Gpi18-like mannosyltransferase
MEKSPVNQTEPKSNFISKILQFCCSHGLLYVALMWLLSRLVILAAMFLIAPSLPAPHRGVVPEIGWGVFAGWDGEWYQKVVIHGYEYANDGKAHNIAFFPLFPLVIRGVMTLGLRFEVAGTLVSNLAFLGSLLLVYVWVEECHGREAARWTTAALAWCPFSLYGTVIYTEGLFMLLSAAALRAFEKRHYVWVALWGALASATRLTGAMLTPAFVIVAWRERRGAICASQQRFAIAYIAGLATSVGLLLFMAYCGLRFGDPLAFLHAEGGWGRATGFAWQGWLEVLRKVAIGSIDSTTGTLKDPTHLVLFVGICVSAFLLWHFRQAIGSIKVGYGFCVLWLLLWLLGGDWLIKAVMVFGGLYLLWRERSQLSLIVWVYGLCVFALILNAGLVISIDRYAYSIVSLAIAFGLLLARYPRWGYPILGFFALLLVTFAVRFSQQLWVA